MGRDFRYLDNCLNKAVSTHAPAWGATDQVFVERGRPEVSTHAPAWGATLKELWGEIQPEVSTHAPAWGATYLYLYLI